MFAELISLLFFSRDYGHRAHLRTQSYAAHMALDAFYKELTEKIDALVEAYQGHNGLLDIPFAQSDESIEAPLEVLQKHLQVLQGTRYQALNRDCTSLHNLIDEIELVYSTTIYKLRFLR